MWYTGLSITTPPLWHSYLPAIGQEMYKYTAKKTLVQTMMDKAYRMPNYSKCSTLLQQYRMTSYMQTVSFMYWYPGIVFYSEKPRDFVPVQGLLFPVELFNEEVV